MFFQGFRGCKVVFWFLAVFGRGWCFLFWLFYVFFLEEGGFYMF